MKKTMYLIPILPLLLSCIESNADTTNQNSEKLRFEFAHPTLIDENECLTIHTQEYNLRLIQSNQYILPTRVETVRLPFKTKMMDIDYCIGTIHIVLGFSKDIVKMPVTSEPVIIENENRINISNDENVPS